jgi:hypothetical protein
MYQQHYEEEDLNSLFFNLYYSPNINDYFYESIQKSFER